MLGPKEYDYVICTRTLYFNTSNYSSFVKQINRVVIHEAVHAAQSCKSGKIEPIGWKLTADNTVETSIKSILYRNYPSEKHAIEREAFLMQGQTDAIDKIKEFLTKYC